MVQGVNPYNYPDTLHLLSLVPRAAACTHGSILYNQSMDEYFPRGPGYGLRVREQCIEVDVDEDGGWYSGV